MEKQAELPKIWCVGVAVCAASYTLTGCFPTLPCRRSLPAAV
ncbi:MAG: hypothetical protein ACLSFT_02645 [Ruminococcus callidus]